MTPWTVAHQVPLVMTQARILEWVAISSPEPLTLKKKKTIFLLSGGSRIFQAHSDLSFSFPSTKNHLSSGQSYFIFLLDKSIRIMGMGGCI